MARRFKFRLEQILNLRKQTEETRARELAEAKGELLKIEESIRRSLKRKRWIFWAHLVKWKVRVLLTSIRVWPLVIIKIG